MGQQAQFANMSAQQAQQQLAFQMAAATHGIRWRVEDAKEAGVSPLIALGAPTFNPGAIGINQPAGVGMPDFAGPLGRAGQDISEAVGRTLTEREKITVAQTNTKLANESRVADATVNELNARANYYNTRSLGTPNFPSAVNDQGYVIPGQGDSGVKAGARGVAGGYENKRPETLTHQPGNPGSVSGRGVPADQAYWTKDGTLEFQPSAGSPASQGDFFNSTLNALRNRLPGIMNPRNDESIMAKIRERFPEATGYQREGFGYYRPTFPGGYVLSRDGRTIRPPNRGMVYRD